MKVTIYVSRNYICKKNMPVNYVSNTDFVLENKDRFSTWVKAVVLSENRTLGDITYAFFNDEDLKSLNIKFLKQDAFTDVLSFDQSLDKTINGDIAVSIDRVKENAKAYKTNFDNELKRVMVHGLLHLLGYSDQTLQEKKVMRKIENDKIKMFHVEP
ncbi:MAG: rRNA maturation RNase YbeY [Flavobacteriaceae bacterium]